MMLKLKLQYFGHLIQRVDSLEKTLMLGGIEARGEGDDRGWDGWMASLTRWTWVWVNSGICWWTGRPGVLLFMGSRRDWATELNWSEVKSFRRAVFHSGESAFLSCHLEDKCTPLLMAPFHPQSQRWISHSASVWYWLLCLLIPYTKEPVMKLFLLG